MEADDPSATHHFYEQKKYSGMFVFIIDDCEPSYIKFSARITLKVIFDNLKSRSINDTNEAKSQANDSDDSNVHEISQRRNSVEDFDDEHAKSDENKVSDLVGKKGFRNLRSISYSALKDEDSFVDSCHSVQDVSHTDEDDQAMDTKFKGSESCESSSETKYNLRQKGKEGIHNDKGQQDGVHIPGKEESVSVSITKNRALKYRKGRSETGKARIEPKDLRKRVGKGVQKIKSKRIKSKTMNNHKGKVFKKEKKDGHELENTEIDSDFLDEERQCHKQSRPQKLTTSQNIKCDYCDVMFYSKIDFFNHRRNKGSKFTCKICGKVEPFEAHLMVHMLSHEPDKGYAIEGDRKENDIKRRRHKIKCSVCGLVRSSIDSLKVHMILHTEESPYRCCLCKDQAFFSLSSLHHHQEAHKISKRFQCKECKMRFTSRTELSKHKFTHEIKCDLCGELFPNKTSRTCHYRTCHPNDVKRCTECLSLFSTDKELQKHILYHRRGKKEQCPVCGIVVTKLKDHMMIHAAVAGENLFACDQCPMKYKRKSSLNKHLLVHTGEKPYACNLCPKKFRSNGMLRKHLLTHTLERPFVCELCGKQFSLRSNLVTHMRIHSETRKYPCPYCLQAFNYKTSLEIHLKCKHSSSDSSPLLSCVHCFQTFQDENSQRTHMCVGHTTGMKTSKEVNQDPQLLIPKEHPLLHEKEKEGSQRQQQPFSHVQEQLLTNRHEQYLSQKEKEPILQRQDQSLSYKPDQHLSHVLEQSSINEEDCPPSFGPELTLPHRQYKPQTLPIGQEPTYITQEPPMMPFLYSNQPHANQNSGSLDPYGPVQNTSVHSVLNLDRVVPLDSVTNFSNPSSINIGSSFTSPNIMYSHDSRRLRPHELGHQSSTISSILSAPPVFRCIPPGLEQHPHSINFSAITPVMSSKGPSETNNMDKQDNL